MKDIKDIKNKFLMIDIYYIKRNKMCLVQNESNILSLATVTLATNSDIASEVTVIKKNQRQRQCYIFSRIKMYEKKCR
jgi:hypothetical protein